MVKLRDIAERANVSISTVSRVLTGDATLSVSPSTREEIHRIADELGYVVRPKAAKSPKRIGVFLLYEEKSEMDDPYYLTIRVHIKEQAQAQGLRTRTYFGGLGPEVPYSDFAGLIVVGSLSAWQAEYAAILEPLDIPVVFVDFRPPSIQHDYIITDFYNVTENCLNHVLELGYTEIGYIGEREYSADHKVIDDIRRKSFQAILQSHGLYREEFVFTKESGSGTNVEMGYQLVEKAAAQKRMPQVFFVENDSMAIGALNCLNKLGIHVPDEVGIISCNDIPTASFLNPPLTTAKIHNDLMGRLAVKILMERMARPGKAELGIGMVVPNSLVVRGTLKCQRTHSEPKAD